MLSPSIALLLKSFRRSLGFYVNSAENTLKTLATGVLSTSLVGMFAALGVGAEAIDKQLVEIDLVFLSTIIFGVGIVLAGAAHLFVSSGYRDVARYNSYFRLVFGIVIILIATALVITGFDSLITGVFGSRDDTGTLFGFFWETVLSTYLVVAVVFIGTDIVLRLRNRTHKANHPSADT